MATLNESVAEKIHQAFLSYDQRAWLKTQLDGTPLRPPMHITLGHVQLRANSTDLLLSGTAYAARSLRSPLASLSQPEELSLQTLESEVYLALKCGAAPPRPTLNRTLRVQPQVLYHESTIELDGPIRYTQYRTNENAERLGQQIVRLGLLRGLVEDSTVPNTWPLLHSPRVSGIEDESLWLDINLTTQRGMSIVNISPTEPPSGPIWEHRS